jgi:colanic acid/amylovoran biosynthesis glycosyltransferase
MANDLLLVLPLAYRRVDGHVHFESQAANGLARWAEHFDRLVVACPVVPESQVARMGGAEWVHQSRIESCDRMTFVDLPWAHRPDRHLRAAAGVRELLDPHLRSCAFNCLALGAYWGDWGTLIARRAKQLAKPYALWFDRAEHDVMARTLSSMTLRRRALARVEIALAKLVHFDLVRSAAVGLFHGRDVYDVYASMCRNPQLVHNIHVKPHDRLPRADLDRKLESIRGRRDLRIVYAGRAVEMKGPMDWLDAVARAIGAGVPVHATWLGEGDMLAAMKSHAHQLGISDHVSLPGFVGDRSATLAALRDADVLAFCHKTAESPRVLIESLISGTPIVGYDSPFPRDLIKHHRGGQLVPRDNVDALAAAMVTLAADRSALADLAERAWHDGEPFNDSAVFTHRAELIRQAVKH